MRHTFMSSRNTLITHAKDMTFVGLITIETIIEEGGPR